MLRRAALEKNSIRARQIKKIQKIRLSQMNKDFKKIKENYHISTCEPKSFKNLEKSVLAKFGIK